MHYLRFCCRSDLGAETIEKCEEFRDLPQRYRKSGGDIMMYTKRWLGDSSVTLIAAVTPEETAREIRNGISSPDGVADLRAISEKVKKRILRQAPVCFRNKDISKEAEEYLVNWCQNNLPQLPRPQSYSILSYRWDGSALPNAPGTFHPSHRMKTIDVHLDNEFSESDSETEDEGPIDVD